MRTYFKADIEENSGVNWLIADFGMDDDGKIYILTTDNVHASECHIISKGAKGDCELVVKLLNAYYNNQIKLPV